jgi:4-aminobutyrate aminotransferase-like enzyme
MPKSSGGAMVFVQTAKMVDRAYRLALRDPHVAFDTVKNNDMDDRHCFDLVLDAIEQAKQALAQNTQTVALLPIEPLFPSNGYVHALQSEGYIEQASDH